MTTATTAWAVELQDALGSDGVLLDPDVTASYARDQAMLAPAGTPAAVVFPRSTDDVVAVMQVASRHGVPVVPRGAGSGLAGSSNAVDGAITLVMTRMDAVLEIWQDDFRWEGTNDERLPVGGRPAVVGRPCRRR